MPTLPKSHANSTIPRSHDLISWQVRLRLTAVRFRYRIKSYARTLGSILESVAITAATIVFGAIALLITDPKSLAAVGVYSSILAQVAATVGTIVAIVFGLALAPVQRAAEALSPAVLSVFTRDRRIRFLFIALGILCVAVFVLSFEGIGQLPGIWAFAIGILFISIAIDLLRWFYRLTLNMLNPLEAVQLATQEALRVVRVMDRIASEAAVHAHRIAANGSKQDDDVFDWKGAILNTQSSYSRPIVYWLDALAEIAKKGSSTGQGNVARVSLRGVTTVVCGYLELRKDDLRTGADPAGMFLTSKTNADLVVRPACEQLLEVAKVALRAHDEDTAIVAAQQLANLALFASKVGGKKYESWRGSLATVPTGYLSQLFKAARDAKAQEVCFQGSAELRRVLANLPATETRPEVCTSIVEACSDNTTYFYVSGAPALAEEVLAYMCEALHSQFDSGAHAFRELLDEILRRLPILAQVATLSHAKYSTALSMTSPLNGALTLVRPTSLPYLLAKQLAAAKVDPEHKGVSPYAEFKSSLERFYRTLRDIAENCEFGATTMFLHDICEAIYYISAAVGYRLENPIDKNINYEHELADKLSWLLSPLWVAYDKKKIIDVQNAERCCDTATAVGLIGIRSAYPELAKAAVSTVRSIGGNLIKGVASISPYTIADCLVRIDYICLAADHLGMTPFAQALREARKKLPEGVNQTVWDSVQEAVELRLQQFNERRSEYSYEPFRYFHAEGELHRILHPESKG